MSTALARLALSVGLAVTTACTASAPYGFHRATAAPFPERNMLGEAEISRAHVATAYDAITRLRPSLISWQRALLSNEPRLVYVDGMLLGGVEWLQMIPATDIHEIRLVTMTNGQSMIPLTNPGGAILITTKLGPVHPATDDRWR